MKLNCIIYFIEKYTVENWKDNNALNFNAAQSETNSHHIIKMSNLFIFNFN